MRNHRQSSFVGYWKSDILTINHGVASVASPWEMISHLSERDVQYLGKGYIVWATDDLEGQQVHRDTNLPCQDLKRPCRGQPIWIRGTQDRNENPLTLVGLQGFNQFFSSGVKHSSPRTKQERPFYHVIWSGIVLIGWSKITVNSGRSFQHQGR
ncbi:MAG: hypothetical protein BWX66_01330 [Deltaproteobacteria bacterium ADurb.Bin058]|nr:MAG: hypothetical protein BWX66_01330 [Deltaproteobacteria bacterium ADurb.Bin058]